jgi:hypothetical protein
VCLKLDKKGLVIAYPKEKKITFLKSLKINLSFTIIAGLEWIFQTAVTRQRFCLQYQLLFTNSWQRARFCLQSQLFRAHFCLQWSAVASALFGFLGI